MNFESFRRVLTTFADSPADVDLSKGLLLVQIRDEVITGEVFSREGAVYVRENDTESLAQQWLINRIARIPQLASRILDYIPDEPHFVTPSGVLLDQLEDNPTDKAEFTGDAVESIRSVLGRRPAGASSVLYLTSDAGEGKTTIINRVARVQATAYKKKEADWLLIPIMLGGRPFLRFDDVVIGELVNHFRFQFFYYDAFIELVRMGVLVPAFDGFEEMFIESGSGEALSALGNLMNTLESSGSVLISARKAYFEYKSFASQARLFDALELNAASFSKLALHRWNRAQFLLYAQKRQISNREEIYNDVCQRLSDTDHPLLTRAVLVKRLLDIAQNVTSRDELLVKLGHAPHDYFYQFVDAIIEREVTEKWIDRSGQPAQPLITTEEHHELLSLIAQEMWGMNTEVLNSEVLDLLAELFSETRSKTPVIARQIKERIKQHALISSSEGNNAAFKFDHEEFRSFFLGQAIGRRLIENNESDLRQLLSKGILPRQTYDAAVQYLRSKGYNLVKAIGIIQQYSRADIVASFTRDNCGGLIIRLLDGLDFQGGEICQVNFPQYSLRGRNLIRIRFRDCYYQVTPLEGTSINSCSFEKCTFDGLELTHSNKVQDSTLMASDVICVVPPGHENRVYDPASVTRVLINAGFTIRSAEGVIAKSEFIKKQDEALELTERALRIFIRSTQIHESVLRTKLGVKAGLFFNSVLPELVKSGILIDVSGESGGGNNNAKYRLSVRMRAIERAMSHSAGNFRQFLEYFAPR
jgi:hypothetical protein